MGMMRILSTLVLVIAACAGSSEVRESASHLTAADGDDVAMCKCPVQDGETLVEDGCPNTDVNGCSGLGTCKVRGPDGLVTHACEYPPGYPKPTDGSDTPTTEPGRRAARPR
jgi:hypothetical protein